MNTLSKILLPLAVLCAAAVVAHSQGASQGPVSITVRLVPLPGAKRLPSGAMKQTLTVLHNRINAMGLPAPSIRTKGSDRFAIQMPAALGKTISEQRKYVSSVIQSSRIELIWLKDVRTGESQTMRGNRKAPYIYEGGAHIRNIRTNRLLTQTDIQRKILYADPNCVIVSSSDLKPNGASVDIRTGINSGAVTKLQFNALGTRKFANFTRTHIGSLLAITLNGKIESAPSIRSAITDGTVIIERGVTTLQEAQELAKLLNAGALPVDLKIVSVETVKAP